MNCESERKIDSNYKWGQIKLDKLPKELLVNRFKHVRPVLADEPLFPSILSNDINPCSSQSTNQQSLNLKKINQTIKKFNFEII